MINLVILEQHADDAVALAGNRRTLTVAPYARLPRLLHADERLSAQLEGLSLSGETASALYKQMREHPSEGALFVLTVQALEQKDEATLSELLALVEAQPLTLKGMLSAFGWVESRTLQGLVARLLRDSNPFKRMIGVAACAMHRVDPGVVISRLVHDPDGVVRARAFRAAGELGRTDLLTACSVAARREADPDAALWAAWSAVHLGDRQSAVQVLIEKARSAIVHLSRVLRLAIQAMTPGAAHETLQALATDRKNRRSLIQGTGIAGDPAYIPWLLKQMSDVSTARIAGEAFALITGVDLGVEALDRPAPAGLELGPTDDPNDPNVEMDADDGLSWPDPDRVHQWWQTNAARFQRSTRYFMGQPVTRAHCLDVLKNGYQRQRILAARYLCLLQPGTPLFNTSAPAWRQQRLFAQMP
jgi:uncharacterized protein (TIGR02270 family)